MKRHVDTGATDKMTCEPWSALSRGGVASSALRSRSVVGTRTKDKQTRYYSQLKGRQCSAPKCDTLLHIGLPSCITTVPTMHQNTFLWLQHHKGQQHKKEHKESRVHQHDSVPPTVRFYQGQTRKSEHIPWDENVVSSHYINDVQLTDCVTNEFGFQQKSKKNQRVKKLKIVNLVQKRKMQKKKIV